MNCAICLGSIGIHQCDECGGKYCGKHFLPCRPNGWHGTKKKEGITAATQTAAVLARLQRGDILTPLDALNDPSIRSMRLAARIWDLRQAGHDIEAVTVDLNDGTNMKAVAGYRLRMRVEPGGQRIFA